MVISDGTASSPEERLENAWREAQTQIASGLIQGAVIAVAGGPAAAAGLQCVHPAEKPMTVHSRFDIASVGKVFTAACCALLAADGELEPDAPFTRYLPEHVLGKSCNITVRDLAMHAGGFDNSKPYDSDDVEIFNRELFGKPHSLRSFLPATEGTGRCVTSRCVQCGIGIRSTARYIV